MTRARALAAAVALVAAGAAGVPTAHTGGSTGYAVVAIDGGSVRYSLTLWPAASPPAIGDDLRRARAGDPPSRQRLLGFIRHKVTLRAGRRRCEPGPGSWPAASPSAESVTLVVDFTCGGDVRDLSLRDDLFDVFGADYHTLARIDAPGRTTQFAFTPETRETRVRLDDASGGRRGMASFVLLGIGHILTGWDHLLFLLGFLLRGGGLPALAQILTPVPLAPRVTLAPPPPRLRPPPHR